MGFPEISKLIVFIVSFVFVIFAVDADSVTASSKNQAGDRSSTAVLIKFVPESDTEPAKFRCGYDNIVKRLGHRRKRFSLLASKWQKWNSGTKNTLLWM